MAQIDLEPKRHSHLYELKPMSRWWLVVPSFFIALGIVINGATNPATWGLLAGGALLSALAILCFPGYWLSKIND